MRGSRLHRSKGSMGSKDHDLTVDHAAAAAFLPGEASGPSQRERKARRRRRLLQRIRMVRQRRDERASEARCLHRK